MTLYLGVGLITAAVLLFILQPVVKGLHASLEREDDELTETEARKRVALLALRDVEYDFLAGKLDEEVDEFCATLLSRPRPAILGLKEYLHTAPRMDEQGALDYARAQHSMVNTAAAMKKDH